jgi:hypothetical protein
VILSVILMGFLIMYSAMPDYWKWAYWANLFHYVIQGLVTNELAGKNYILNLNKVTGGTSEGAAPNATSAYVFRAGTDLSPGSRAVQVSAFLDLAIQSGPGINSDSTLGTLVLQDLVQCMVANDCLVEPIASNFLSCCVVAFPPPFDKRPPCGDEFDAVTENLDLEAIGQCFAPVTPDTESLSDGTGNFARGVPIGVTDQDIDDATSLERMELVKCLIRALLPPEKVEILLGIFKKLYGIVMFILDIAGNGIPIPGELILFVFGWADLEGGEFDAPYKWYYCIVAVAGFLLGIEFFKLVAVRFVVWTKR